MLLVYISQASGAYIFRPNSSEVFPINDNNNKAAEISVVKVFIY